MQHYFYRKMIGVWIGVLAAVGVSSGYAQHHYFAPASAPAPQLNLPRATLKIGNQTITVQVASTYAQRQKGLMHRMHMSENEGMLFVFDQPAVQCFWMRNTPLPLTAAFIQADGKIVNLADMQPFDEASHCAVTPVLYVLEMNQGWFQRNQIAKKTRVSWKSQQPLSQLSLQQKHTINTN